ncbi:hypothetical protein [Mucilaginibacter phyllosphaerae]|uniref:XRE family transcriptional regulator n=1 Tax=Mucilaginibacter phyllosphaerae TaxID=1812349 RepID=A0A4Y8AB34_9SPHI|nr:hypothetical protein [Mucilaginibacter phyllosphaerae]MBB3969664.1 hypothetical protein [Mucilaginibacter phyllosphaerae]TEW65049.1 hypothetical protein E2R65_14120 [Mucilaginibacter phyllosphaerae]GGH18300.1 hypothetical protein GCM10007352_28930 [Mucilaginibacter phyllosphaerae]
MDKHYGQIVEYVVRKKGYSITDLAKAILVNRRSIYNWFNQKQLKSDIIYRIGYAIKHDFSNEFPELFCTEDFKSVYKTAKPFIAYHTGEDWKSKYLILLEKYNLMLLKKAMSKVLPVLSLFSVVYI